MTSLIDQRGTGGSPPDCPAPWSDDNLQPYLDGADPAYARVAASGWSGTKI